MIKKTFKSQTQTYNYRQDGDFRHGVCVKVVLGFHSFLLVLKVHIIYTIEGSRDLGKDLKLLKEKRGGIKGG